MTLVFSETPFATGENDTPNEILERVGEGKYTFNSPGWNNVSDLAKDLVGRLLHVDPARRLPAKQILVHPWIVHRNSLSTAKLNYTKSASKIKVNQALCKLVGIIQKCDTRKEIC